MSTAEITCSSCGATANRTAVFQHYGFRLRVPCKCGELVETRLQHADLPAVVVDFERSTLMQLRCGVPVTTTHEVHPGVAIDADTPLWALY